METLIITLCILSVFCLMFAAGLSMFIHLKMKEVQILLEKADATITHSKQTAEKVCDAHNSLTTRVVEISAQLEALRNKVEFQSQMRR